MHPFAEKKIGDNTYIREFSEDVDSSELHWHRDREDRIVEAVCETDWMIQLDDELPRPIVGCIEIPVGVYHRLIKGTGNLKIKVIKLKGRD